MVQRRTTGFTVVELLVVLVVLGILASITIISYNSWQTRSAQSTAMSEVRQAASQAKSMRNFASNGQFPANSSFQYEHGPNVTFTYVQRTNTSTGDDFCVLAVSKKVPTVAYYMKSGHIDPQVTTVPANCASL